MKGGIPRHWASSLAVAGAVLACSPIASPQGEVTFKAETDLVLVPVVVRDANGNTVGNLRKEDFRLFDKGKAREITKFTIEDTTSRVAPDKSVPGANPPPGQPPAAMAIPDHFVALQFDDIHMKKGPGNIGDFGDLVYSRDAALKFLDTLRPGDRVAVFTTSDEVMLDFTYDRAKLREALLKLRPSQPNPPAVSACRQQQDIERESRVVVMQSADIVRRMASLPGQRTLVLVSSGLMLRSPIDSPCPWTLEPETTQLIDKALHSHLVINGLDARGLAITNDPAFQAFQDLVTDGTGGRFIENTNDLKGAVRQLGDTPRYIYVLGFSPEPLQPDGRFHSLTVKLVSGHKLTLQARKGYWAPGAKELARKQDAPPPRETANPLQIDEAQTKEVVAALGIADATRNRPDAPEATLTTVPAPAPSPAKPANDAEISTHDAPATFKVQSNLVEVPVIVRDRQGQAIGNLSQNDFRILDKGKRQEIAKFSVRKAAAPAVPQSPAESPQPLPDSRGAVPNATAAPVLPSRFVAFVFDDVNMHFEDLPQARAAVDKYVRSSLQPGDRVALYTTSGRIGVDFTNSPEAIGGPLMKISPSPIGPPVFGSCGARVSYFQAVQIDQQVGLQPQPSDLAKSLALRAAVDEFGDFHTTLQYVRDAYYSGLQETRAVLATLKIVVQRMGAMPGNRSVVLVSPGFFVPPDLENVSSDLMALAVRSKVLVSAIDARGVWTNPAFDACRPGASASVIQDESAFASLDGEANTDELIALAEGTGGSVNLNNDFYGGVLKAAAAPEYLYLLAFAPQNLKFDGSFHALKVTLANGQKASIQARRGYWAPKHPEDPLAAAKQEIESAVFSRDEIHNLPVEMHTQVLKAGDGQKLNVLASVDLKQIHLRKSDDRNRNDVTIVAAVFDANGNFIAGKEKILQLRLRDDTVRWLEQRPPVTIDTDFDMPPGVYLVRLVVRDAEDQELTAENAGVQVP